MGFKAGDRVSFLSEKREGVVKKILPNGLLSVEIDDGFEIPVLAKELIKIGADGRIDVETTIEEKTEETPVSTCEDEVENETVQSLKADSDFIKKGVFIALEPLDTQLPLNSGFHIFLINKTDYDLIFTCYNYQNDAFKPFTYDVVAARSMYKLATIKPDELILWSHLLFHFVYYSDENLPIKEPHQIEKRLNTKSMFKAGAFRHYKMTDFYCYLMPLVEEEAAPEEWPEEKWENEKIINVPQRNIEELCNNKAHIASIDKKHISTPFIAEVDLHIEQLVSHTASLNNHEKLNAQIAYFVKILDAAIVHKFKKVTFIHGVGSGKLKESIYKIIEESYPGLRIQDAPFKKYGLGATEVLIPFNLVF